MNPMDKFAEAQLTSLMPLRKPLAKWSIRFTFGISVAVLALDAMGNTPSTEVLAFLESVITMTTVPVIGYIVTSTGETIAKLFKGKEGDSENEDTDDSHHYRGDHGGGVIMGTPRPTPPPPRPTDGDRGDA